MALMRILCAPDSFKETICATAVAEAMAAGIRRVAPACEVDACPVGDGGEGTLDAIIGAAGGRTETLTVTGPTGRAVDARLGLLDERSMAVVELAEASGLDLVPPGDRDPTRTTTYGTGELLRAAIGAGHRTVVVAVGGSGTVDGGAGLAQAVGIRFLDGTGTSIAEPLTGGTLEQIARVDRPPLTLPRILVACDVTSPLCGPLGAAAVYGPQKGADPAQVQRLEAALAHLASVAGGDPNAPGAGAAGGAAYGLAAMLGAELRRGIELVLDVVGFHQRVRGADLVITGEGRLDGQTAHGKAVDGVATAATRAGVRTVAIVGDTGKGADACGSLDCYVSLAERFGRERALREPAELIELVAAEMAAEMAAG